MIKELKYVVDIFFLRGVKINLSREFSKGWEFGWYG